MLERNNATNIIVSTSRNGKVNNVLDESDVIGSILVFTGLTIASALLTLMLSRDDSDESNDFFNPASVLFSSPIASLAEANFALASSFNDLLTARSDSNLTISASMKAMSSEMIAILSTVALCCSEKEMFRSDKSEFNFAI